MKIIEIYIYGYGKFENIRFSNLKQHQVFFGENEAGKTTIMSFIHSILFGFPTRQQSEQRYEPKNSVKYGGQITACFPKYGKVVIERVKGKSAGDVVVRLENGNIGGEDFLKKILLYMDKSLYQSIFSFNLHGLQNIHQMKGEDLGRFLFSTGTLGTDRLLKAESELSKELDARFKPNGRNPRLNSKLKELRLLQNELHKAEKNNDRYIELMNKKEALEKQIESVKKEIDSLMELQSRLEEWKRVFPLYQQEKVLKEELVQLESITFPDNGIKRYEHLVLLTSEVDRKIKVTQQRIEKFKNDISSAQPNNEIIAKENEINGVIENMPLLEKWRQEEIQLQFKRKKLEEDIQQLHDKMNLSLSPHDIQSANTSIFMKEKVSKIQGKQNRLLDRKIELDEIFQDEKTRLEELELKAKRLETEMIPETDRKKLEEKMNHFQFLSNKLKEIDERVAFFHKNSKSNGKTNSIYLFLSFIFTLVCISGIFMNSILLKIMGGIGVLVAIFLFFRNHFFTNDKSISIDIKRLLSEKEKIQNDINQDEQRIKWIDKKLKEDYILQEKLRQTKMEIERQTENYDRVINRFEQWEEESIQLQKDLLMIGEQLHLPVDISLQYIQSAYDLIEEIKRLYRELDAIENQLKTNYVAVNNIINPLQELSYQFLENPNLPTNEAVKMIKENLRNELEKQVIYNEKQDQLTIIEHELDVLFLEEKGISESINQLFSSAHADNEEHFKEIGKKALRKQELENYLNHLSVQLKMTSFTMHNADDFSNIEIQELIDKRETKSQRLVQLQEEFASVKYHIQILEDGGTYADLLHRFMLLRSEFEEKAKEWAKYAAAKEILQKTIHQYKQERLPKMIVKAEEYLFYLTGGKYRRIIPKEEGSGFYIESVDGLLFEANELSQATAEQLYVSIRLALAITVYGKYQFPIIIDDSFVNFDAPRTRRVIELIKQFDSHQVFLFTCHRHVLDYFESTDQIHLDDYISI